MNQIIIQDKNISWHSQVPRTLFFLTPHIKNKVVFKKTVPRHTWTQSCTTWCILNSVLSIWKLWWEAENFNSFTDAMPKWSLTRLSYSLYSCWSPGYLVSVLTSHSLTCSAVLVHTTFGFVTFWFVDHVMSVLFFFSVAFSFCFWLVYQVPQAANWPQRHRWKNCC